MALCSVLYFMQLIRTVTSGPVKLVGYSFGACVAVEMALQLQSESGVSSLVLLDGSHAFVASFTGQKKDKLFGGADDAASIETTVICSFVSQLAQRLDIGGSVRFSACVILFASMSRTRNELLTILFKCKQVIYYYFRDSISWCYEFRISQTMYKDVVNRKKYMSQLLNLKPFSWRGWYPS
jgi:pimeloyl-ACP methyl ester carboxylesterase